LPVKYDKFESKEAARRAIIQWGNDIYYRRAPFEVVAKTHSQDPSAQDGGRYDWTTKDSLKSEKLNQAIFSPSLPEGALSQIIEDDYALHIVRVIKREDLRRAPFNECQPEIKKRLSTGNQEKAMLAYIEKLREHTPVWTRFDANNAMATPPQSAPRR
jgi:parvulin-like peptidyl-prolyl isomerase